MPLILILLFLVAPMAEIYVLLTAGSMFGALPVIGACIFTAILGGVILRAQGVGALAAIQRDMSEAKAPIEPLVDGAILLACAPFLMTPGFITDVFGFALLVPPLRRALARRAFEYFKKRIERKSGVITIDYPPR